MSHEYTDSTARIRVFVSLFVDGYLLTGQKDVNHRIR